MLMLFLFCFNSDISLPLPFFGEEGLRMENSDITVENTESEPSSEEVTASTSEAGEKGEEGGATSSEEVGS